MFILNMPFRVVASSTRKEYSPKRGSTGFISHSSFPAIIRELNGTTLPVPIITSIVEAVITRFGFERKERAERRTFYAVLPLILPYSEIRLSNFLKENFKSLCKKRNISVIDAIAEATINLEMFSPYVVNKRQEFLEDSPLHIRKPILCVITPELGRDSFPNRNTVNIWFSNILRAISETKEETRNSVIQTLDEPLVTKALQKNRYRKEIYNTLTDNFKVVAGRKMLSVYQRNRFRLYRDELETIFGLPKWANKMLYNDSTRALYLNHSLRLSLISNLVFLSDSLVKVGSAQEVSDEIHSVYTALMSLKAY